MKLEDYILIGIIAIAALICWAMAKSDKDGKPSETHAKDRYMATQELDDEFKNNPLF